MSIKKISGDTLRNIVAENSIYASNPFTASGGNEIKLINGFYYHLFTSNGTFYSGNLTDIEITMIAGGGGGSGQIGGGGGGGGWMPWKSVKVTKNTNHAITIGSAGNAGPNARAGSGGDSTFVGANATLTVKGGGAGGIGYGGSNRTGVTGGCGGGAAAIQGNNGSTINGGYVNGSYMGNMGAYGIDAVGNGYGAGGGGGVINFGAFSGGGGTGATVTTYLGNAVTSLTAFSGQNVIGSGGGGSKSGTNYAGGTGGGNAGAATMYGAGGGGGNGTSCGAGYQGFVLIRWEA
jgi:hypothetical protein